MNILLNWIKQNQISWINFWIELSGNFVADIWSRFWSWSLVSCVRCVLGNVYSYYCNYRVSDIQGRIYHSNCCPQIVCQVKVAGSTREGMAGHLCIRWSSNIPWMADSWLCFLCNNISSVENCPCLGSFCIPLLFLTRQWQQQPLFAPPPDLNATLPSTKKSALF